MNKSKAALYNMISAIIYQIVASCGGLIIPGLVLAKYGAAIHGYSSTVSNILVYVSLVTAGLAPAAIQAFYEPLHNKNNEQISCVFNTVTEFYMRAGALYLIVLLVAGVILQIVLKGQLKSNYVWGILIVVGLNGVFECFTYSRCRVILLADQHLYYVTCVDSIAYFIRIIIQLVLLLSGQSVILVMAIPLLMLPLRVVLLKLAINKRYAIDRTVKTNSSLLSKRYSAFVHQISSLVVLNTDVILLTIFGNLIEVSIYAVYNLVFSSCYSLLTNMFKNGNVAIFGNLLLGEKEHLLEVYSRFELIYYIVVSVIYSCCAVLILPFVRLYTYGQDTRYDIFSIALLFIIIGIANNIRVPSDTVITAAGHFKETQSRAVLEATINLVVSLALIKPLGIVGILLGTICSFVYRSTDIVIYTYKNILKQDIRNAVLRIIRMVITITISYFICSVGIKHIHILSWGCWFLVAIVVFAVSSIVTIVINMAFEPNTMINIFNSYFARIFHVKK